MSKTDFEDEYPAVKDACDFFFPVVQAEITECSTYAVVYRLKSSPPYTITSNGGLFNLPDYPSVSVTIPKKAVGSKTKIPLQIKVSLLAKGCGSEGVICTPLLLKCAYLNRATERNSIDKTTIGNKEWPSFFANRPLTLEHLENSSTTNFVTQLREVVVIYFIYYRLCYTLYTQQIPSLEAKYRNY